MTESGARRVLAWAPVLGWATVIFVLSAQPGLRFLDDGTWDLLVRKAGHMAVFGILALLAWRALATTSSLRPARAWAAAFAILYAATDEVHQGFVADRTASLVDLGIDALGVLLAIIGVSWLRALRARRATA